VPQKAEWRFMHNYAPPGACLQPKNNPDIYWEKEKEPGIFLPLRECIS